MAALAAVRTLERQVGGDFVALVEWLRAAEHGACQYWRSVRRPGRDFSHIAATGDVTAAAQAGRAHQDHGLQPGDRGARIRSSGGLDGNAGRNGDGVWR